MHQTWAHPTMNPVELVERALRNSSRPGDTVLDCFGGSGTTLIAAEKTGRRALRRPGRGGGRPLEDAPSLKRFSLDAAAS
jgi:DNA modification methylase